MTTYRVIARVSGGITGCREAPLKKDGQPLVFATRAEADAVARDQNTAHRGQRGPARFHYWVETVEEGR